MADDEYDELIPIGPVVRFEATWDDIRSWGARVEFTELGEDFQPVDRYEPKDA